MSATRPDHEPDADLLASISDGAPADWGAAARSADAARRLRVESLQTLARIADFNRGLQRGVEPAGTAAERWGDMLLLERLGAGARAEVFRAWDPSLQREVALKLIPAGDGDASLIEEGRALARIRHPNVVTVYGVERRGTHVGMWMELIRGATLEQQVRAQDALDPQAARRLGTDLAAALAAVHAAGMLHRDVKPANVVRDSDGRFVLTDFGLGRRDHAADPGAGPSGTPMYMAPELLAGAPASERSDVYALGLVIWFALAGRHPFEAGTLAQLADAVGRGPDTPLRTLRPEAPAPLVEAIEQAIAPDPAQRPVGAAAFGATLAALSLDGPAAALRARAGIAATLLVVALAVFTAWIATRRDAPAPIAVPAPAALPAYSVEAAFLRRDDDAATRLASGDRVQPGDRLSLELRVTRPAWVYVLNEDEQGERYLLFPQPRFDARNPLAADSAYVLPGTADGREAAWRVTSAGGREHFLVVVSPEPVPEIEAELERLPAPEPGRGVTYARVGEGAVARLRGVGGVVDLPEAAAPPPASSRVFERFRALGGRESDVRGVWVRQIVLENPER